MSMGFHEDDRIRRKNRVYNEAEKLIETMRFAKLTDSEIAVVCLSSITSDNNRNEIYSTVLRIVGGSRGETT